MEAKTTIKALGGAGVLGASGYGIHTLSTNSNKPETVKKPETIGDQLKLDGEDILPTDDDSEDSVWTKLVKENEEETDERKKGPNLTGSTDKENIEAMKESCSALLNTKLTDAGIDGTYNQAKRWCVKKKG